MKTKLNLTDELSLIEGTREWYMVKEFIKRLKAELKHEYDPLIFEKKINKLVGESLIE